MSNHPNTYELKRIRLTKQVLTAVAAATVVFIALLAVHGNFDKPARSAAAIEQPRHHTEQ